MKNKDRAMKRGKGAIGALAADLVERSNRKCDEDSVHLKPGTPLLKDRGRSLSRYPNSTGW